MCCSEKELGISDSNDGIMDLTDDIPLGTDLKTVYDIEDINFGLYDVYINQYKNIKDLLHVSSQVTLAQRKDKVILFLEKYYK